LKNDNTDIYGIIYAYKYRRMTIKSFKCKRCSPTKALPAAAMITQPKDGVISGVTGDRKKNIADF